jgi:dihydroxyacid dehydratase/phosphogluconate dehydratase
MEETYQVTSALKHLSWGKEVAVVTDARFSGVSTGACIGHVGPEALAGGPIGRVRDDDWIAIQIDRIQLTGSVDMVGTVDQRLDPDQARQVLTSRAAHPALQPDPRLPDDTWGGCVYDVDSIVETLEAGRKALADRKADQR